MNSYRKRRKAWGKNLDSTRLGNSAATEGARLASRIRLSLPGHRTRPQDPIWSKQPGDPKVLASCLDRFGDAIAKGDSRLFHEVAGFLDAAKTSGEAHALQKELFLHYVLTQRTRMLTTREILAYVWENFTAKYPHYKNRPSAKETLRKTVQDLVKKNRVPVDSRAGAPKVGGKPPSTTPQFKSG